MRSILTAGITGIAALAAVGTIMAAAPALAANACSGSSCGEGASVSVLATITETITPAAFTFGNGHPVAAGSTTGPIEASPSNQSCTSGTIDTQGTPAGLLCPDYSLLVSTGDGAGYAVMGSAPDLVNGANSSTIPAANLAVSGLDGASHAGTFHPLSNAPAAIFTTHAASAPSGDQFNIVDDLAVPGGASGTYSTTITYAAVAN